MDPWLKRAAISWAVFWLFGLYSHWRVEPRPSDVHLPQPVRLLFGGGRRDGTLNAAGVCSQLFGYLLGILAVLAALKVINRTDMAVLMVIGATALTAWFFWQIRGEFGESYGSHEDTFMHDNRPTYGEERNLEGVKALEPTSLSSGEAHLSPDPWVAAIVVGATAVPSLALLFMLWVINVQQPIPLAPATTWRGVEQLFLAVTLNLFFLLGIVLLVHLPLESFSIRLTDEGVSRLNLWVRSIRWTDVTRVTIGTTYLWVQLNTARKSLRLNLFMLKEPERVLAEILSRVPAETPRKYVRR